MTENGWVLILVALVFAYAGILSIQRRSRRHGTKKRGRVRRVRHSLAAVGPRIATTEQRDLIYRRDGGVCHYCKLRGRTTRVHRRSFHRRSRWTSCYACGEIDHIDPYAKGGATVLSNLILSCYECNRAKGTRSYDEFVRNG